MLVAVWQVTSGTGILTIKSIRPGSPQGSYQEATRKPARVLPGSDQEARKVWQPVECGRQPLTIEKFMRREAGITTPHA